MGPILLKSTPATQEIDQAGVTVDKRVWSNYNPGYYTHNLLHTHMKSLHTLDYVPPLQYFCLKALYPNVDSIEMGGLSRFPFHPDVHMAWLKGLIPFFTSDMRAEDLKYVDPRLWGTLIQLYGMLPPCFHTYTLPLSDIHLSQLQAIRSTPNFTLITVLDLSSRPELTDETIGELKPLTNLCVLDLSLTGVGSWGVKKLSMCLVRNHHENIGPWGLRIWSLRGCKTVDDTVKDVLERFPLLCAVDLRDTSVTPSSHFPGYTSKPPSTHTRFYHPNPPLSWIDGLCKSFPGCRIFQSSAKDSLYIVHVNKLEYPIISPPNRFREKTNQMGPMGQHNEVLAIFPNGRNALYRTRNLSQGSQQEVVRRLFGKARKSVRRHHHAYGPNEPEDTYNFSFGHMGGVGKSEYDEFSDRGLWSDDRSEDGHSDHYRLDDEFSCHCSWCDNMLEDDGLSEDNRSQSDVSEYHQRPFDAVRTDGPFDLDPNTLPEYSKMERELLGPIAQHNEVAARVTKRHAAEQEARRFYRPDFPELRNTRQLLTKRNDQTVPCPTETGQLHISVEQVPPPSRQWTRMFFRTPPAYDSISHGVAPETGQLHRTNRDEGIVAKKRKTGMKPGGVPKTLLHRQAIQSQTVGRIGKRVGSHSARSLSGSATRASGESCSCPPPVPMNPFLAKMKCPVQSLSTSKLDLPSTPYCQNESKSKSTASATQPRTASRSQLQLQPSHKVLVASVKFTAPGSSTSCTTWPENKGSGSKKTNRTPLEREEKLAKSKQRKDKQFDMRAWVTQTTKSFDNYPSLDQEGHTTSSN